MTTAHLLQRLAALIPVLMLHVTPALAESEAPPGALEHDRLEAGRRVLEPFQTGLQAALQEALAKGPAEAVDACRVRAPEIALDAVRSAVAGAEPRVAATELGRTSHKLRNPANAPREWVRPLLATYLARPDKRAPRAVDLGAGRWGYVQPIFVQPLCLTCHGSSIAGPLKARIAELYPEDRAVGFSDQDFRGLFWAEFAPPP